MTAQRYSVALGQSEVQRLTAITRKGVASVRVITRARILLMANGNNNSPGKTDREIREALGVGYHTPFDIRKRYAAGGVPRALYDAPRPGKPKKFNGNDEAVVTAIACTSPPGGYDHWTLDLITDEFERKQEKTIGRSTIHRVMLKNKLKPWRKKNVEYSPPR